MFDPLGMVYLAAFEYAKRRGLKKRRRLPFRTISIGNITTGGTGKTPAAIALAFEAQRRNFFPIILTRGYKGTAKGPCFVTKGDLPLLSAKEAGDEPRLMAEKLRGVPIVKGKKRFEAGMMAIGTPGLLSESSQENVIFILDDGFQHWGLERDVDIVLIDSLDPFGSMKPLPFGRLREPLSGLSRADIILIRKTDGLEPEVPNNCSPSHMANKVDACISEKPEINYSIIESSIMKYAPEARVFIGMHTPTYCSLFSGEKRDILWLKGKRIYGFCGVGNPESFRMTLMKCGAEVCGFKAFTDHKKYTSETVSQIINEGQRQRAECLVTTEKDAVKIRELDLHENMLILYIEIEFSVPNPLYEYIFRFM